MSLGVLSSAGVCATSVSVTLRPSGLLGSHVTYVFVPEWVSASSVREFVRPRPVQGVYLACLRVGLAPSP